MLCFIGSLGLLLFGQACAPRAKFALNQAVETIGPDPLFSYQWFLGKASISNISIQTESVWSSGNHGEGVTISVVDPSSIYLRHTDLNSNKDLGRSFNFYARSRGTDTTIPGAESHGTCAAGVIGAREQNSKGIVGVASRASISARTTSGADADIFDALTFQAVDTDVSSNSYGPPDSVAELNQFYSNTGFNEGIKAAVTSGRDGLGTVFVWAGGNGREFSDRSNYDGYASNPGVMSICSVGKLGGISYFSEPGSNLWVCAPGENVPATDYEGLNCASGGDTRVDFADINYTKYFTGTSAAAPVVSGVVGLVLREAELQKKRLGWRDVKMIIAESADKPQGVTFQSTRIGFNDDFGFGIVNAKKAVDMVKSWAPVGNGTWLTEPLSSSFQSPIGSGVFGDFSPTFKVPMGSYTIGTATVKYIEHMTLEIRFTHPDPGALEINLLKKSLDGTLLATSKIATPHSCQGATGAEPCAAVSNQIYIFGVVNFLGESAQGIWELDIRNGRQVDNSSIAGWRLKIYGH